MNRIARFTLLTAAAAVTAVPSSACAQRDREPTRIDSTFAFDKGSAVDVGIISGDVTITGWARPDAKVYASTERGWLDADLSSHRITLRTRSDRGRSGDTRVEIMVPIGTRVQVSSISGNVRVTGTGGEVDAGSVSGSVEVVDATDRINAHTVSGKVHAAKLHGRVRLGTTSNSIDAEDIVGDVLGGERQRTDHADRRDVVARERRNRQWHGDVRGEHRSRGELRPFDALWERADVGAGGLVRRPSARNVQRPDRERLPDHAAARRDHLDVAPRQENGIHDRQRRRAGHRLDLQRQHHHRQGRSCRPRGELMRRKITTLALVFGTAVPPLTACTTTRAYAQSREHGDIQFSWSGAIQAGHSVYVRNLNGAVRVEAGTGDKVEVHADKRARRGNPDDVKITVKQVGPGNGDDLVCALWNERSSCDEDGYHSHNDGWRGDNDRDETSVEFVIKLPAGVKIDASTVNGSVDVDGATSDVMARAVNGSVEARSTGGAVSARTTNGNVEVSAAKLDVDHSEFTTVNGTVTVSLPASVNADVEMNTVNGSLTSDFPLTVQGSFNPRRLHATLGKGGATLRLSTVNGSIRLRKLS